MILTMRKHKLFKNTSLRPCFMTIRVLSLEHSTEIIKNRSVHMFQIAEIQRSKSMMTENL